MIQQLRIYQIEPGLKSAFDQRFRQHAIRIMGRYNFAIKAMWYSETNGETEFVYILEWDNRATLQKQWDAFMADPEWIEVKRQSREQYGEMVLEKKQDQVLLPTEWFQNTI